MSQDDGGQPAPHKFGIAFDNFAADFRDETSGATGTAVGGEDGLAPPSRERARHVSRADYAEHVVTPVQTRLRSKCRVAGHSNS